MPDLINPTAIADLVANPYVPGDGVPKPALPDRVFVTVAFGPPTTLSAASVWHAVHWNKVAEMMRPYGWQEVERVYVGGGKGSYVTFSGAGTMEPKLPQAVQDWLESTQPKTWKIAVKIARAAAGFLNAIAMIFGVSELGHIGRTIGDVTDAVDDALDDLTDDDGD